MSKICLLSFDNIYVLPYAKLYIDSILDTNNSCELLYWDRTCSKGKNDFYRNCIINCFEEEITPKTGKFSKFIKYIKCIHFFKKELKKNNYDKIIILQTHAGVFCNSVLKKKYQKKYILDIRDYTLENIKLFYNIEKKCIENSKYTVISSPAYKLFLPESDYILAHNIRYFDENLINAIKFKGRTIDPINIVFIGTIRFVEMDKKIIDKFGNDDRFTICYYGVGSDVLKEYAKEKKIKNVDFKGKFSQDETIDLYKNTSIINNLYGNHSPFLDYALSNKLYHAVMLNIPILVCEDTYMEKIALELGIGFVFKFEDINIKDKLYNWYKNYDFNKNIVSCSKYLNEVYETNEKFYDMCNDFINKD